MTHVPTFHSHARGFLRGLLDLTAPTLLLEANLYTQEYETLLQDLDQRYRGIRTAYPTEWSVESETGRALYSLVRQRRPSFVVETGVANGHSTVLVLQALKINGHGRLLSVDVSANVGALLCDQERDRWELSILPRRRRRYALSVLMAGMPEIDLFIHDSDHSYGWKALEYALAWPQLSRDGILFTDDVHASRAFFLTSVQGRIFDQRSC